MAQILHEVWEVGVCDMAQTLHEVWEVGVWHGPAPDTRGR